MSTREGRGDRTLLLTVLMLLGLGSATVFSSTTSVSTEFYGSSTRMFLNHLTKVGLGLGVLVILSQLDYRVVLRRRLAAPLVLAALVLLAMTLVPDFPLAVKVKGATRWIRVGAMVIQPAEIAKLAIVVYVASILAQGEGRIRDYKRGFGRVLTVLGLFAGFLMLQPNFGNVLSLTLITVTMVFVGGARIAHLATSGMGVVPVIGLVASTKDHVMSRVLSYLHPGADPTGAGFQLRQSLVALGSGGMFGLGPGSSRQSEFFLPDCHTDFVFAVLGEEFGLVGTVAVVVLFGIVIWRGIAISRASRDLFGRYLAVGITAMIGVVAFLNMSVVLGLAPTTGLPLPFLSYGGSAMLVNLGGVGILLSIASRSRAKHRRVVV